MARGELSKERETHVPYLRGVVLNGEPISLRELLTLYEGKEKEVQQQLGGTFIASLSKKGPAFIARAQRIYRFFKASKEEQNRILAREEPLNPKELNFTWKTYQRGP